MADVTTIKTDIWNGWQNRLGKNYLYPNLKNLSSDTTGLGSLSISGLNAYLPQLLSRLTGGGNVVSTTTQGGGTGEYQVPSYLQTAIDALTNAVNTNYWNTAAGQERIDDFSANVMPAISRKFAPSGFWSSQRTQTEDIARESLMEELAAAQSSNLTNNATALGSMASIPRALEEADLSSLMSILGLEYNTNNALMNALGLRQYDVTNIAEDDDDGDFLSSALGLAGDLGSSYVLGKMLK